jgi:8-oxo-dGTP pyrophosphatase MutT (NUDIX family)
MEETMREARAAITGDNLAYRFPVSIKGAMLLGDRVPLLKNERDEWELPGGKLELGEEPASCCAREIEEELHVSARVERLLDAWVYTINPETHVLIVTYGCLCLDATSIRVSHEHKELGLFRLSEIASLNMPRGYKTSIQSWARLAGKVPPGAS